MTPTPDPIAAIERALEGVEAVRWGAGEIIQTMVFDMSVPPDHHGAVVCEAPIPDIAAYIAACNPVAITALLSLARQAAEKDAEIVRLREALEKIEKAPAWGAPDRWETTPAEVRHIARAALNGAAS